jgi:ubiquinone/menaquinone biosynthesis C-methylase UbiE
MTATLYDRIGNSYDITRTADQEILKRLKAHLDPISEGLYLDVACGSGNYTVALADLGYNLYGIDVSEKMLRTARSKSSASVRWLLHDATTMPFVEGQFSGALCICAVHHFSDLVAVFQEVYRTRNCNFRAH